VRCSFLNGGTYLRVKTVTSQIGPTLHARNSGITEEAKPKENNSPWPGAEENGWWVDSRESYDYQKTRPQCIGGEALIDGTALPWRFIPIWFGSFGKD